MQRQRLVLDNHSTTNKVIIGNVGIIHVAKYLVVLISLQFARSTILGEDASFPVDDMRVSET